MTRLRTSRKGAESLVDNFVETGKMSPYHKGTYRYDIKLVSGQLPHNQTKVTNDNVSHDIISWNMDIMKGRHIYTDVVFQGFPFDVSVSHKLID